MADNMILSRPGVANLASDGSWEQDNANFQQIFTGEVLTAFAETNIMRTLHLIRTIDSGKSAEFPVTWKFHARYHTPGQPILGNNQMPHKPRVINIDDLLIADTFLYNLDDAKNHYDVRGIYSGELGNALARAFDNKCLRVGIRAARSAGLLDDEPGGSVLKDATAANDGEKLADLIFKAAEVLDEKDVPDSDRHVIVRPAQYYLLTRTTKVLNKDWDGAGSYSDGKVTKIAGITVVKSNNIPKDNVTAAVRGENNDYTGDFSNTLGLVMHKSAFGTVQLMDIATQMSGGDVDILYQGTLMVAKMAVGHGILRPCAAVELSKAAA